MKVIIETERCCLREFSVDDAQSFYDLNADPEVVKYTGDGAFDSLGEAKSFLLNYNQYELHGFGRWAVIDKQTGEFLGWCGLKFLPQSGEVDLGYRFFRKYWNQGYATETANACIGYGFNNLGLSKIIGRSMKANVNSVSVLEKIGMTFKGKINFDLHEGLLYEIENTK